MNNKPIGIFDSGIGGLTVLKKVIEILPEEKYIYYADIDNVPYGIKSKEEVKKYVKKAIEFFISKQVKAIVIACNTATSVAINDIRKEYTIPIIGIEPALKPAIEKRENKKVLVMATPITIKEKKLQNLVKKLNATEVVDLIDMPKLVEFAENMEFDSERVKKYILERSNIYDLNNYSVLVLGCTHFPLFKKVLSQIFPSEVQIIDGSSGVANRLKDILEKTNMLGNNKLEITYYHSGILADQESIKKYNRIIN